MRRKKNNEDKSFKALPKNCVVSGFFLGITIWYAEKIFWSCLGNVTLLPRLPPYILWILLKCVISRMSAVLDRPGEALDRK